MLGMMILPHYAAPDMSEFGVQALPDPGDPASAAAPQKVCYAPGAARSRGIGRHHGERLRIARSKARAKEHARKHAAASSKIKCEKLAERMQNPHMQKLVRSVQRLAASDIRLGADPYMQKLGNTIGSVASARTGQQIRTSDAAPASAGSSAMETHLPPVTASTGACDASMDPQGEKVQNTGVATSGNGINSEGTLTSAMPIGSATGRATISDLPKTADDNQPWLVKQDNFEQLVTMHLQGGTTSSRAKGKPKERAYSENTCCPFSEEDMDSTATVDLRCGHRFSLAQLSTARLGPTICSSAGFALRDALICPLCGDQDITTMPGRRMLTCYSTDTDAYLGELRKDWQRPLHLPMQQAGADLGMSPRSQQIYDAGGVRTSETFSLPSVRK
jgi:hypothetical protein